MERFIERLMTKVNADFADSIAVHGSLCPLKGLTYEGRRVPDYTEEFIRQYYILRFFPAYLFEYYTIYDQILSAKDVTRPLNVLSIGCGCGVDYYGLDFALKEHPAFEQDIRYTGLDIVDWNYRKKLGRESVFYLNQDISEWESLDEETYNIIIFPKSMSEFPSDVFDRIKCLFENSTFRRKKMTIACSLMHQGRESDIARVASLAKIMKEIHGYTWRTKPTTSWHFPDNEAIITIRRDWSFPKDIQNLLDSLLEHCPTYLKHKKPCKLDCVTLNRSPILRSGKIRYQTIGLERE